jgi:GDP-L-fucose synthase
MKIVIAGATGMVGSALIRKLSRSNDIIPIHSAVLDLTDRPKTFSFIKDVKPDMVFNAAAKVGGILENDRFPSEFLSINLQIQTNLFDACNSIGVERVVFLGSSCIYPNNINSPIKETDLMNGPLEPTNSAYAIAKIAGIEAIKGFRKQYNRKWISIMPTNLYGPNDNFDLQSSHVLPALIRKFHIAMVNNHTEVILWGTGNPRREFLHVDDLADASVYLAEHYDSNDHINVGTGYDLQISELATLIASIVGYAGQIKWDAGKPDGTLRKVLDVTKLKEIGWKPSYSLESGIRDTYAWFLANSQRLTGVS